LIRLGDYLRDGHVRLDLAATEKDACILELAETLRGHPAVRDWDALVRQVIRREKAAATALGSGIAIPHARTAAVTDFVAALGRSRHGVDFGASDGEPARLILLMAIPPAQLTDYLQVLTHLSALLERGFVEKALVAQSPAEVIVALREVEGP
jgi:mannitol/fructose-specific phosphotransferase system IIA component (Ntr-type)